MAEILILTGPPGSGKSSVALALADRYDRRTILLITHQPEDIERLADQAMFIDDGAIRVFAPKADFLARRAPEGLARFLGR